MSRSATLAGYAVLAAAMVAHQVAALRERGRRATLGDAAALVAARPLGRAVVLGFWLWAGWHVFVRFGG